MTGLCAYGPGGQTEANTEMGLDPKLCLRKRPSLLQRSDSPASCPRNVSQRTSQVVQWLGLCTSTAGSLGLILGWGRYRKSSSQKKEKMWARSSSCYSVTESCPTLQNHMDCSLKTWTYFHSWGQSSSSLGREGFSSLYQAFPLLLPTPLPAWEWLVKLGRGVEVYCPATGYVCPLKGETGCAYAYLDMENWQIGSLTHASEFSKSEPPKGWK